MIDILLALYNGENFIEEQIDSILRQTFTEWRLTICDDCSTDNSYNIAEKYARIYPEKIKVYKNSCPTGSAQANFMNMVKYAQADYIMFCDQDDVWLPEKIEITLEKMISIERDNKTPVLVHSELFVVDKNLKILNDRFTCYQGLNPRCSDLNRLLVQNNVTGCTVMINRRLLEIIKNVSAERMLMHDWWFALVAASFGKIAFIEKPLINYRQHDGNQLGAVNNRNIKEIFKIIVERSYAKTRISVTYEQAYNFYEYYKDKLSKENIECIEKYLKIPKQNKMVRIFSLLRGKYLKQSFLTAVGQLLFC